MRVRNEVGARAPVRPGIRFCSPPIIFASVNSRPRKSPRSPTAQVPALFATCCGGRLGVAGDDDSQSHVDAWANGRHMSVMTRRGTVLACSLM